MAKRRAGVRLITGDKELDAALSRLKLGVSNKVARPALTASARVYLKAMKGRVAPQYKHVKQALGMVVNSKGGVQRAKVGAGVGKAFKYVAPRSGKNKGGVGMGGRNLLWLILGTKERTQKTTGKKTGAAQAKMPVVKDAASGVKSQAAGVLRETARDRLMKLAAKK